LLGLRAEDTERAQTEIERERFVRPVRLVEGGPSRQETVARCLEQAAADTEVVLVHDAVRPFIDLEMISRLVAAARQEGAAILGIPSVDTVKQVQRNSILGSIPRERIVLAQTPQAFRYEIIREAYSRAMADGFQGTDDSSLAERLGYSVTVIMGSDRNIKITKPSDLPLARLYLAQEHERQEAVAE
jgi:2-C-methyl-D-erythritol 4-phosphate cytidylyltransferase